MKVDEKNEDCGQPRPSSIALPSFGRLPGAISSPPPPSFVTVQGVEAMAFRSASPSEVHSHRSVTTLCSFAANDDEMVVPATYCGYRRPDFGQGQAHYAPDTTNKFHPYRPLKYRLVFSSTLLRPAIAVLLQTIF
jgi:hypothetical protein